MLKSLLTSRNSALENYIYLNNAMWKWNITESDINIKPITKKTVMTVISVSLYFSRTLDGMIFITNEG